ncbi:MAG: uroporphyrinogen-III C-methyltransferase [Alphaproteobacteria bacterium]|nr:MAG: uroporphyrinogen-III C-methyltransferase [Alphaproteobacteria bacterium]
MTAYVPLFIHADRASPILVIGGGEIACAKVEALSSVGVHVRVVARDIDPAMHILCAQHDYEVMHTSYHSSQLEGIKIVVAATDDDDLNATIAQECRLRNIWVNVVDNPPLCDFIFPALVRRGSLQIAISTSGVAPVLARMIKQKIEMLIPPSFERLAQFLEQKKSLLRAKLPTIQARRLFCEDVINGAIAEEVLEGNLERADRLFDAAIADGNTAHAALYVIGAGAGHPELITLKAIRLLSKADVIMVDRLVSPALLDSYARKDAEKIFVGKTRTHHHKTQSEIDALIESYLRAGKIVARLKGGDPAIYAHCAEEIAIAQRLSVPYQIVAGVTAASGCAAFAGIPLTERGGAMGVRILTLYNEQLHDAEFWESLRYSRKETLVLYMSSHQFSVICTKLMALGFAHDTRFLAVEQGTTPYHKEYEGTLGTFEAEFGAHQFASPCLMIIGDVVRYRAGYRWKEAPAKEGNYFPSLPKEAS